MSANAKRAEDIIIINIIDNKFKNAITTDLLSFIIIIFVGLFFFTK